MNLIIGWLYPDLLNLYGDRGNIICLKKRAEWRGISVDVKEISTRTKLTNSLIHSINFLFMGGGPDNLQKLVYKDFLENKRPFVKEYIENSGIGLFICGAYQLLGHYYRPAEGPDIPGLGVLDLYTQHFGKDRERCVGNVVVRWGQKSKVRGWGILVGFENHGGRTYLGKNLEPLGAVIKGFGNNGEDKTEGAIYKNTFGTYLHGPILPKNPHFADFLLAKALKISIEELEPLDDSLEWSAHKKAIKISKSSMRGLTSISTEKFYCVFIWLMEKLRSKPYLRAFSGLFVNLSAAWFSAVFVTPGLSDFDALSRFLVLTEDIAFGTIFLMATIKLGELLE